MLTLLAYLKDIIIHVSYFYVISLYFKTFFELNLLQVIVWWAKNFSEAEYGGPLLLGLFFTLLFSFFTWSNILTKAYHSVLGETKTSLYVGNQHNGSYFVDAGKLDTKPFNATYASDYNSDFKNIYAKTTFIKDKGTQRNGYAAEVHTLHFLLALVLFGLVFTMILWGVLHNFGYQAYVGTFFNDIHGAPDIHEMFRVQADKTGLTNNQIAYVGIALSLLATAALLAIPKVTFGRPAIDISHVIYPGATVEGKALRARKIFETEDLKETNRDTGWRYATFEFTHNLPTPVYVSLYFEKTDYPKLYDDIHDAIKSQRSMPFTLSPELQLQVIQ